MCNTTDSIWLTWLIHVYVMTHSYVWRVFPPAHRLSLNLLEAFIPVAWLIHMRDTTHSHEWHDSFMCVTWLLHLCDMTHSCVSGVFRLADRLWLNFHEASVRATLFYGTRKPSWLLQHAATRYNTLQHAATQYNALQRTATHGNRRYPRAHATRHSRCNTLQHAATRCNTLRHTLFKAKKKPSCSLPIDASSLLSPSSTHCNSSQHTATHCNTPQHTATHRNTPYSKAHETHPARCLSTLCLCFRPHSPPTRHFPCAPLHWRQTAQFRCSKVRRDSFICVPWLIHIHVCHDSFICVPWLLHMCTPTLTITAAVPLLICVTWLIHMCVTTHSFVCRDSSICMHLCATTHACVCDVTHSYVWDE